MLEPNVVRDLELSRSRLLGNIETSEGRRIKGHVITNHAEAEGYKDLNAGGCDHE